MAYLWVTRTTLNASCSRECLSEESPRAFIEETALMVVPLFCHWWFAHSSDHEAEHQVEHKSQRHAGKGVVFGIKFTGDAGWKRYEEIWKSIAFAQLL